MKLSVNGVSYYVEVHGSGPALLLLHGFSGSHEQWHPFVASWSNYATLIAVDLLGHHLSDAPSKAERYQVEHTVRDLVAILDQLKVDKATVLGYSMGGRIAIALAELAPHKVEGLILESTSPGLATASERELRVKSDEALAERIEIEGIDWFAQYWGQLPLFESLKQLSSDDQHKLDVQRRSHKAIGLANSLRGIGTGAQPSWWSQLHKLTMPILIIVGEQDDKFHRIAMQMQQALTGAETTLEVVIKAGHNAHMEQPQSFATIVEKYILSKKGKV